MFELLTALILFWLPIPPDRIAQFGFEGTMYISTDRPATPVWTIDSTNHNAAFVTSADYLTDGKVAIPTRITWDVGSQNILVSVTLSASISGFTVPVDGLVVLAMLCPKTPYAIPATVPMQLPLTDGVNFLTPLGGYSVVTVTLNNGSTALIYIAQNLTGAPFTPNSFKVQIQNALTPSLTTWATSGQTVDIGEVWFGNMEEFRALTDPKYDLIDPTLMRRSHSNQPWPLFVKPYSQWTYNFAPMDTTDAFDSSSIRSFDSVRYELSQANCAFFLTRIFVQGTDDIDQVALFQQSCFGKPDSVGALSAIKEGMGLWNATAKIGESPP